MGQARCNARRRRQAVLGFTHIAAMGRPIYKKSDAATAAKRLAAAIATERRMAQKAKK